MIFLSFAPNFSFARAIRHLFAIGTRRHSEQLKSELKKHYDGKVIRLYPNGRTALAEAISCLVPSGAHVAINGLTCHAVPQAVKAADCHPVYVDINDRDFNYDISQLRAALKKDPAIRAIIIQNHLGLPADIISIEKLASQHKCIIIEDLAHCAGAHYADGREAGTIGAATALSFGKNKSIDTTDGGALVLRDDRHKLPSGKQLIAARPIRLRARFYPILGWLIRKTYRIHLGKVIARSAFKSHVITRSADGKVQSHLRLTHWQARLALRQIRQLPQIAKTRNKYAKTYNLPATSAPLRIPILVGDRDKLLERLHAQYIYLDDSWYDVPVSPKRYYHPADYPAKDCPTAVRVASQMINLPLMPKKHLRTALAIIEPEVIKQ